jgi:hypothetical protein
MKTNQQKHHEQDLYDTVMRANIGTGSAIALFGAPPKRIRSAPVKVINKIGHIENINEA